ncbi:hypothetical protein K435DRAFT_717928 [Dendrothele bispora CBS 962.96]|uniref:Kinetochore protein Spc24 n=1 Tax=Dendrothele bispora (strain CBS 962.96) TaxID=1314807 RepID=A0A4S8MHU9_DENBC|nr:hypothetical protein K435DRAFT_964505 [Dendrothele bispora CBS 962.96]THV01734.1 hypothetical protein K435DRAFT_717928 [Dendrothele bispora CBS 962.96]
MIPVEEAVKAIQEMAPMIDPDEDYVAIVEAEEKFAESEAKRRKELEEAYSRLKALSKVLEAARVSSTRPKSVLSIEAHTATLNELDSSRLSLAKSISDAEGLLASREAELAVLKEETQSLEVYDPAVEHIKDLDGTAIRLQVYKGLGFEPVLEKSKVIVRSQSGDIHSVPLGVGTPGMDVTGQLWNLAAS